MIQTFDFVFHLQRDNKDRKNVLSIMNSNMNADYDYVGWHLHFDAERKWVQITDNGKDKYLSKKFIPAEMSYRTLLSIINKEETDDLEIRYLE